MNTPHEIRLLSVYQVAETFGIGVSSVWRHVRKGMLPAPIRIGGTTRWRLKDIEAVVADETT